MKKLILIALISFACGNAPSEPSQIPEKQPRTGLQIVVSDSSDGIWPDTVAFHTRNWDYKEGDATHYLIEYPGRIHKGTFYIPQMSFGIEYSISDADIFLILWNDSTITSAHYKTP